MKIQTLLASLMVVTALVQNNETIKFPEAIFGVYKAIQTPEAILGPLAANFINTHEGAFSALRDNETGTIWFTLLAGQIFRVDANNSMQYCFGEVQLQEQSPFSVNSSTDTEINFCWRTGLRGMPTHKLGCAGCDCAHIALKLTGPDTLDFKFWMSPPVLHAHVVMNRTGPMPTMGDIKSLMLNPYKQCRHVDHYGPNIPGEPNLRPNKTRVTGGCALSSVLSRKLDDKLLAQLHEQSTRKVVAGDGLCYQLNGFNFHLNTLASPKFDIPDIKLQFRQPTLPCDPCYVSYSVSAEIKEDEYIALGFKGQSWENKFPFPPETPRPCYFGMCIDAFDNFTSDRLAVGYSSSSAGSCVREMVAKNIVGAPEDVAYPILVNTTVKRVGIIRKRTVMRFTALQHWPNTSIPAEMHDGPFRVMWAIGQVSSTSDSAQDGCGATIGFHGIHRGVAPLHWLVTLNSMPCVFDASDMGEISRE